MAMNIDKDVCTACGECATICPTEAIGFSKGAYKVDTAVCTECDGEADEPQCMNVCPDGCIDFLFA